MKSQRRHELKQNVLGAELGKVAEFLKKRGTQIAWGVLLVAVIIFAVVWWRSRTRGTVQNLESRFQTLCMLDEDPTLAKDSAEAEPEALLKGFKELAQQDKVQRIAAQSCVKVGDILARQAFVAKLLPDREDLQAEAAKYYRRAIDSFPEESAAVAKAHLGLALLAEDKHELAAARKEYQAVLGMKGKAPSLLVNWAQQRMEGLDKLDLGPLATTAPSEASSQPASPPATAPATRGAPPAVPPPASKPAPKPAATGPATRPASGQPAPKPATRPAQPPATAPAPAVPRTP